MSTVIRSIEVVEEFSDEYEFIKFYDIKQGVKAIGYVHKGETGDHIRVRTEQSAKKRADEDSKSRVLLRKAMRMALDQVIERVLQDNEELGLGITTVEAIDERQVYFSESMTRPLKDEDAQGYQAALNIHLNVAAYRRK